MRVPNQGTKLNLLHFLNKIINFPSQKKKRKKEKLIGIFPKPLNLQAKQSVLVAVDKRVCALKFNSSPFYSCFVQAV